MIFVRHLFRTLVDLAAFGADSGRWWVPAVTILLGLAVLVSLTAKAVVGPAVYVLF